MPEQRGARTVTTNQEGLYKDLERVVRKYAGTRFLRPVADHTREAFAKAKEFVDSFYKGHNGAMDVVLDSGCGTGESTFHIAKRFPDMPVIGIDKSAARLERNPAGKDSGETSTAKMSSAKDSVKDVPANAFWIRAELLDFWRLALDEVNAGRWRIPYHALYYPNPWPKQSEATRRFHLHPIFPTLLALGQTTELRTNWEIYAREFAEAAGVLNETMVGDCFPSSRVAMTIRSEAFTAEQPITAFERKYKEARQQLWRVLVNR